MDEPVVLRLEQHEVQCRVHVVEHLDGRRVRVEAPAESETSEAVARRSGLLYPINHLLRRIFCPPKQGIVHDVL
jgi:hypothetical protein